MKAFLIKLQSDQECNLLESFTDLLAKNVDENESFLFAPRYLQL